MMMFITAEPSRKLCARGGGGGDSGEHVPTVYHAPTLVMYAVRAQRIQKMEPPRPRVLWLSR